MVRRTVGEQDDLVPALGEGDEQRQQNRADTASQWLISTFTATAPATARSTKPMAIVSTSRMTMCFKETSVEKLERQIRGPRRH